MAISSGERLRAKPRTIAARPVVAHTLTPWYQAVPTRIGALEQVGQTGRGRPWAVAVVEDEIDELRERIPGTEVRVSFTFTDFYLVLQKRFESGQGYYGWSGLRYFLYEYELELRSGRPKKVDWGDLLKTGRDKISIEHIYPQSETVAWQPAFRSIRKEERDAFRNSLGNLLLLSSTVNSSLQNDAFAEKKEPKYSRDGTTKLRNGYADGSHSEIDVSRNDDWGPAEIRDRGIRMIRFMERRWNISFGDDQAREKLLFIGSIDGDD